MKKLTFRLIFLIFALINGCVFAQQNIRDKFLVEKIILNNNVISEYIYDVDNKLLKITLPSLQKYVRIFEYENERVSKIIFKDSVDFMFDYDTHFFYNSQGQLIRSEEHKNGFMIYNENYHYENGRVVSIYEDGIIPFEYDRIFYDNAGNVTERRQFITGTGKPYWRTEYYEYDNNPKPNYGLDYILSTYLLPGHGDAAINEMCLSKNNMTKMLTKGESRIYTYNEFGLPKTYEVIWEESPAIEPQIFHITYKQVEVGVTDPIQELPDIKVYPNPTTGEVRIMNYELRIMNVEVFDVYGRKMLEQKAEGRKQNEIDISGLSAGIYFVKIITEKGVAVKKVVKQ